MRKLFLFLVITSPLLSPLRADDLRNLSIGVEGGVAFSYFNMQNPPSSPVGPNTIRPGIVIGLTADWLLASDLFLSPEVNYLQGGINNDESQVPVIGSQVGTLTNVYDEISVPINVKWKFGNQFVLGAVFAGPRFGYAINRSVYASGAISPTSLTALSLNSFDFGADIGGGIEFLIGERTSLFANARDNFGIANIDTTGANATQTRGIEVKVGVQIGGL